MIRQKRANLPVWKDVYACAQLPENLRPLNRLAHNLWWVWNAPARELFRSLNPELWMASDCNPVLMMRNMSAEALDAVSRDADLMKRIDEVCADFESYMAQPADEMRPSVAYFSMEYGLTHVLKTYSGGLGVLAGDYLKEASDSNVRLTAVGLLYRYGYFTQDLNSEGRQIAHYEAQDFSQLPLTQVCDSDGKPMVLEIPMTNHVVYAHVWLVQVGRIHLYLMDTDIEANEAWDKEITHKLYGGDWENRMRQEYLLGIGGMLMLNRLGIHRDVYHMNEGHAAFMNVQRLADKVQTERYTFEEALELVRASSLYTVHTPVPAGHDYFDEMLLGKYMGHFPGCLGITWPDFMDLGRENPGSNEKFSMSVFALNTCQEANGVSRLHGRVSQQMFAPVWKGFFPEEIHVGYVTNGVHLPTWATARWQEFYRNKLGADYLEHQTEETLWKRLQQVPSEDIWTLRQAQKRELIAYIKQRYTERWVKNSSHPAEALAMLEGLNPNALWVGFGRRFATYKRAHLLFTDIERLKAIANDPERPVIFVFTGKAHPADGGGQGLIKLILEYSRMPEFAGKILFLENYDIQLAQKLIPGVDVWMNTPTRPLEASGTSGQKAEMNGVLNLSVLDGWWYEGYCEKAGWALTDKRTFSNQEYQDKLDAATIYDLFEREIIPLYFQRERGREYSEEWVQYIKNSLHRIAPHFTMRRMLDDYYRKFYAPLAQRYALLCEQDAVAARKLVAWKRHVEENWESMHAVTLENHEEPNGMRLIRLTLDRGTLHTRLDVQLVIAKKVSDGQPELQMVKDFTLITTDPEARQQVYELSYRLPSPGYHKEAVRVLPHHDLLPHRMDFAYINYL